MEQTPRGAVHYPFKFSAVGLVLCIAGLALCAAGLAFTAWQLTIFFRGDISSVWEWLKYGLLLAASLGLLVIIVSMLIRSRYTITDDMLIMRLGIIRQRFPLKTILSVHLFRGAGKLAVYFDDFKTNYVVIVIKEEQYDAFIRDLTARNEKIAFTFSTAEEEDEFKKK